MSVSHPALEIDPEARVDPDARIYPSVRGTRTVLRRGCMIAAFTILRSIGGTGDLILDENASIGPNCLLYSGSGVYVGKDVLVGPQVSIVPVNHAFGRRDIPIAAQRFDSRGGIIIEDDVWIGAQSIILDGSHIHKGAIIAAGSVVRGDISEYSIWAGVPAQWKKDRP